MIIRKNYFGWAGTQLVATFRSDGNALTKTAAAAMKVSPAGIRRLDPSDDRTPVLTGSTARQRHGS
jgi:hypothetical protein